MARRAIWLCVVAMAVGRAELGAQPPQILWSEAACVDPKTATPGNPVSTYCGPNAGCFTGKSLWFSEYATVKFKAWTGQFACNHGNTDHRSESNPHVGTNRADLTASIFSQNGQAYYFRHVGYSDCNRNLTTISRINFNKRACGT
jgi:hypothetical protein